VTTAMTMARAAITTTTPPAPLPPPPPPMNVNIGSIAFVAPISKSADLGIGTNRLYLSTDLGVSQYAEMVASRNGGHTGRNESGQLSTAGHSGGGDCLSELPLVCCFRRQLDSKGGDVRRSDVHRARCLGSRQRHERILLNAPSPHIRRVSERTSGMPKARRSSSCFYRSGSDSSRGRLGH
jgi:hypothetical protein